MSQSGEYILTIDVGTTNCKCVVFASGGTIVGQGQASYPEQYPQPGWVEQKPGDWWSATVASVHQALSTPEVDRHGILAIGVTGQMHGILAIDDGGRALTPCLTLRDGRATAEENEIVDSLGLEGVYRITGARLAPSLPLAKIDWIRKNHPHLYRRTRAFLPTKDYIRYLLTGDIATEVVDAAGMLLYDVHDRRWSAEMAQAAGISIEKLPPLRSPWEIAGKLGERAAEQLGLVAGTPVVVGAGDDIEFLGFGIVESGMSLEHIGTTGSIMTCVDRPVEDPAIAVELYPHIDPSLWLVGGSVNTAGGAIDWALRVFYGKEPCNLDTILGCGENLLPSLDNPLIFLPHLAGERCPIWDPAAKGGWFGLTLAHEGADLLRAVLEGVTFSLRHVLEKIEEMAVPVSSIAVRKPDQDPAWLALRASIYGKPLRVVANPEPTALGTMILAGIGIGLFADMAQGVEATRGPEYSIDPDEETFAVYEKLYALYRDVSSISHPLFSRFFQLGSP
jgi:xylulokinase